MSGSGGCAWSTLRVFFIISTLLFRRAAGTDDPNDPRALGKADQQKAVAERMADDDLALLLLGMHLLIEDHCERITKDGGRLVEAYLVLPLVRRCLILVPFKVKGHAASRLESNAGKFALGSVAG